MNEIAQRFSAKTIWYFIQEKVMAIRLYCPNCRERAKIEMVSDGVIITQFAGLIQDDYEDGWMQVDPDYEDEYTIHDKNDTRYQCEYCGYILAKSDEEFVKWYNAHRELVIEYN